MRIRQSARMKPKSFEKKAADSYGAVGVVEIVRRVRAREVIQ